MVGGLEVLSVRIYAGDFYFTTRVRYCVNPLLNSEDWQFIECYIYNYD